MQVSAFINPEWLIEIEVDAVVSSNENHAYQSITD
jgi:hypothetical protein